jgi:hypothetical protein
MAFMLPEYTEDKLWWNIDGTSGVLLLPQDEFTCDQALVEYIGEPWEIEELAGVGVRLSAPGFLDCTDWDVFNTLEKARKFVQEHWECDPDTGDAWYDEEAI